MYGGSQDSLQLLGMEQPVEAQGTVSLGVSDTTPPADERVCEQTENVRGAYEENLNVKKKRKTPERFRDYEMYNNVLMTSGINLHDLSLYQKNISDT